MTIIACWEKPHKFRAKRTTVNGKSFPSKAEARAYQELLILERAGKVNAIVCQHPFFLHTTGLDGIKRKLGTHRVDFSYWDCERKERRFLEVKGIDLALGKWKRRHAEGEYGIKIELRR